jgi:hypothetical protein
MKAEKFWSGLANGVVCGALVVLLAVVCAELFFKYLGSVLKRKPQAPPCCTQ